MAALRRLLIEEQRSLVTLWGSGGIGKTRLARELVRERSSASRGEVCFCTLAGARSADEIVAVVGGALALSSAAARTHEDGFRRIATSLSTRGRMLIVLDNVEQVLPDIVRALSIWTTLAPEASFLVTSRELLGIPGETPLELSPLHVPRDSATVQDSDAVRLLLERARAVRPDFDAPDDVLRDIVTRLDGIPLALELAAARLAVMSAEQLQDRLDRRFDVLVAPHGGAPQRQRTLRGAIDWSWQLLDPAERVLLAELSTFRGGFDLEAAEAVATPDPAASIADLLTALRHKSLVAQVPAGPDEPALPSPRFALLESIRDYAREKLGASATLLRDRHAAYFVGQASRLADAADAASGGSGASNARTLWWFARERDNLLAVVDHFLGEQSAPRARVALALLDPVQRLLAVSGSSAMLVDVGGRVLAAASHFDVEPLVRMRALEACGLASYAVGQLTLAHERLEAASRLADGAEEADRARIGNELGAVLQAQGRIADALVLQHTALAAAERAGARHVRANCLGALGSCYLMNGEFDLARQRLEQSLALHRESGDLVAQARAGARLGFALQNAGDATAAKGELDRALGALARAQGGRSVEGVLLGYRGNVFRDQGRWGEAHAMYDRAIALLRLVGDRRYEVAFHMDRAVTFELAGSFVEASPVLEAAASAAGEIGDSTLTTLLAGYLAVARAARGDHAAAGEALRRGGHTADAGARRSLEIQTAHVALLEARDGGDRDATRAALRRARAVLSELAASPRGEHPRLAALLLERTVLPLAPPADALVVTPSRDRVRLPGGPWIDVSGRPAVQRIVGALVDARLRAPGEPVPLDVLVQAGWPDERLVARAGANRLRVLLASLRGQGLRDVLQSLRGGYLLAASVNVVVSTPLED
jgi:predicted ATPase